MTSPYNQVSGDLRRRIERRRAFDDFIDRALLRFAVFCFAAAAVVGVVWTLSPLWGPS